MNLFGFNFSHKNNIFVQLHVPSNLIRWTHGKTLYSVRADSHTSTYLDTPSTSLQHLAPIIPQLNLVHHRNIGKLGNLSPHLFIKYLNRSFTSFLFRIFFFILQGLLIQTLHKLIQQNDLSNHLTLWQKQTCKKCQRFCFKHVCGIFCYLTHYLIKIHVYSLVFLCKRIF